MLQFGAAESNLIKSMSILQLFQLSVWKQNQQQQRSKTFPPSWAIDALCVVVLVLYFLYFALPAVGGHFADDEIYELYSNLVPRMVEMGLGKYMLLEGHTNVFPTRRRLILRRALSLFWPESAALSHRPDQHSCCLDSDALLSRSILVLVAFCRVSGCSCSLLSRETNQPGFSGFV